ncbi:phage antirepressor KilAC domain-containing protein [Agarilytica rhodophyticola]|uniref:phage antirepressor KilAC domain-containing protein n=1 Tax=Agarilytica rhodophyticola TaxID=1737490 RepID=UPI0013157C4D|nr:phage regulatory protein/antirepressor Ant [Agarilytica rhodophyticola]
MSKFVSILNGEPVTTSLAIAEGVELSHKSVIQLIRQNISDLEDFGMVAFEMRPKPKGQRGGSDTEYAVLNEQHSTLLITYMRNNDIVKAFKKRLVKEFFEAKKQSKELSRKELALMVIKQEEEKENLEQQKQLLEYRIIEDAPKVEAFDRICASEGSMCITDTAKELQMQPKKLFMWLDENGWIYKRTGTKHWVAYQDKIHSGYLWHKTTTVKGRDGEDKFVDQVRVRPKGLTALANKLNQDSI